MRRELVWSSGECKSFTSVSQLTATAWWKVIMLGFVWCDYYRDGEFVRRYEKES